MLVFLVGDPANDGKMDFKGFMEAYTQYFGTPEQPNLPHDRPCRWQACGSRSADRDRGDPGKEDASACGQEETLGRHRCSVGILSARAPRPGAMALAVHARAAAPAADGTLVPRLPPVRASMDRVIKITVCTRPFGRRDPGWM